MQAIRRRSSHEERRGEFVARNQTDGVAMRKSALQSGRFITSWNRRHRQLKHHQRPTRRDESRQQLIQVRFDLLCVSSTEQVVAADLNQHETFVGSSVE
jgi:hypothetical protein